MTDIRTIRDIREARFAVRRAKEVLAQPWFGVSDPTPGNRVKITRIDALGRLNFYDEFATPEETSMPSGWFARVEDGTVYLG